MSKTKTNTTPLLELLNNRWNEFIKDIPDPTQQNPHRGPVMTTKYLQVERQALELTAQVERSDPFAVARVKNNIRKGYVSAHDVIKDMSNIIAARQNAKAKATIAAVLHN